MSFIGKDSWLSNQDIKGHGEDETGRPVSPAPSIEGDVNEAEQINVVFPDGEDPVTMTRRDFMRVSSTAAAAGALATTSACQIPTEYIAPLAERPEGFNGGQVMIYNSASADGSGTPIRIRSRGGRPIHIESNPDHPLSGYGITARQGAAILDLYDPDRAQEPLQRVEGKWVETNYGTLDGAVAEALGKNQGKVVFLTGPQHGIAISEAMYEMCAAFGGRHLQFQSDGNTALLDAAEASYGIRKAADYRLGKARVIVGFGAEFLDNFLDPSRLQGGWSEGRNVDSLGGKMARTIVFDSRMTITGANADIRHRVAPRFQEDVALAVLRLVAIKMERSELVTRLQAFTPEAVAETSGLSVAVIQSTASDLLEVPGESVVMAGGVGSSKGLEVAVNLLNDVLANTGQTVHPGRSHQMVEGLAQLKALADDMNAGKVGALVVLGANPVHAGSNLGFKEAMAKVNTIIVANDRQDETGKLAHFFAPLSHNLEGWSDIHSVEGVHSIRQPAINPLYNSRSMLDHLIAWGAITRQGQTNVGGRILSAFTTASKDSKAPAAYHFIRDVWNHRLFRQSTSLGLSDAMAEVLRNGFYDEKLAAPAAPKFLTAATGLLKKAPGGDNLTAHVELMLVPTTSMGDGTGCESNNGWLQELADPISKVCWDNHLSVSMKDARVHLDGARDGDLVKVATRHGEVIVPVVVQPGMKPGVASLGLGYGRTAVGVVGNDVGVDAFKLIPPDGSLLVGANIGRSDDRGHRPLAKIQGEDFLNNTLRPLAPEGILSDWEKLKAVEKKQKAEKQAKLNGDQSEDQGHKDDHGHGDGHGHGGGHHELPVHWYVHDQVGYASHGDHKVFKGGLPGPSLWQGHEYPGYRWAMTVDTNTCTGCSSCVIACQSENNIPVVGRKGVLSNREMAWIRLDRYYAFDRQADDAAGEAKYQDWDHLAELPEDAWENPKTHFQPMMCQHCENAGCETVCPFTASMHDDEGVNQQIYNRCVGTRYCANNCAYKVRRYNWFEYGFNRKNWIADLVNPEGPKTRRYNIEDNLPMRFNPEVTVRTRGVMEKCNFCSQRISAAKQVAKIEGRKIQDGDIQPACQAACPSNGVHFGDINNPESAVANSVQDTRSYRLLEEVGAKPSVFYMARIWNV